jgi:hypothetical protein
MSYDRDLIKEASCERRRSRVIMIDNYALVCDRRRA